MQEKFNVLVENLKEEFLPVAMEILPGIMEVLGFIGRNMKTLIAASIAFKVAQTAAAVASLAVSAVTNPGKALIGLGIAAVGGMAIRSMIGDGVFPAGGRAILSPTEGGLIPISNNDDIVVAPRLAQAVGGGGTSQNIQNKVDISPSNTNITLNLNGQAIGNANARQAYGVGNTVKALGGSVDYSASV